MNISDGIKLPLKQVFIGVVIVAVLSMYPLGYLKGVSHQKQIEKDEYSQKMESMLKEYAIFQIKLDAIAERQQEAVDRLKKKQEGTKEEVQNYGKNVNSSNHSLDSEWVRVYNNSLRQASSEPTSTTDVKSGGPKAP